MRSASYAERPYQALKIIFRGEQARKVADSMRATSFRASTSCRMIKAPPLLKRSWRPSEPDNDLGAGSAIATATTLPRHSHLPWRTRSSEAGRWFWSTRKATKESVR
jgi:hypothetical protein